MNIMFLRSMIFSKLIMVALNKKKNGKTFMTIILAIFIKQIACSQQDILLF